MDNNCSGKFIKFQGFCINKVQQTLINGLEKSITDEILKNTYKEMYAYSFKTDKRIFKIIYIELTMLNIFDRNIKISKVEL